MEYPDVFPMAEVSSLLGIVKSGTIRENIKKAAHDEIVVQAWIFGRFIGHPDNVGAASVEDNKIERPSTDEIAVLDELAVACDCASEGQFGSAGPMRTGSFADNNDLVGVDPVTIFTAITTLISVLRSLGILKKRN